VKNPYSIAIEAASASWWRRFKDRLVVLALDQIQSSSRRASATVVGKAVKGPQIFFSMLCTASRSSAASGRRLLSSTTSGLMHLWTTPVLAAKPVAASDDAFLDRLSAHGVDAHHRFAQALAAEEIEVAADDFDDLNGAFYKWQQDQHDSDEPSELYASLVSSSEFTTLRGLIADAAVRYIEAAEVQVGMDDLEIFAWAAILRAGESHMPHAHPSSLISGVFWSRVPENAGPLLLDDPRGPLPPFVHKVPVEPVAGELVMFPSWLQHQVLPRHFEGERVSWSFNISDPNAPQQSARSWESTSAIHLAMPDA
jgi:hypothetical protein